MSPRRVMRSTLALVLVCALPVFLLAGTTGKIAGKVVDAGTREALVGVNVVIDGTTLGASSDLEGGFLLLSVPPGTHRLKASLVGYSPTIVGEVRVFIDQTTTLEVTLNAQTITAGEIIVTAQREIVRRDVSTSVTSLSNDDVRSLPVHSVAEVTGLQAGIEGGLTIRGGGADQSLFLVDGVTLRDPRNNQPITSIPLSAVSEISVERGGFNAEYGQLRSGIINVVTREGATRNYTFTLTGRISPPAHKYSGISPYDPASMWLRPYLDPSVAWTGTASGAWDYHTQRQYPGFEGWDAVSRRLLSDADPTNDLSPAAAQRLFAWQHRKRESTKEADYNIDAGFGGPVPIVGASLGNLRFFGAYRNQRDMLLVPLSRDDYYEESASFRLTSDLAPTVKLDLNGTLGRMLTIAANGGEQNSSTDYLRTPEQIVANFSGLNFTDSRLFLDSYHSLATVRNSSLSAKVTSVLSPTAFAEGQVEYVRRSYDTAPVATRNTSRVYELFPGYFVDETPYGWDSLALGGIGSGMVLGGHTSTARDKSILSSTTVKGNVTAQLDAHNQVKAGFEVVANDLQLDYGVVNLAFPETNNYVRERHFPIRGAIFAQDKLEFGGFVANLGLRLDYSNANVEWFDVGTFEKSFFTSSFDPARSYPMTQATAQWTLSPRLGVSHPITENSKLYFNYGHFKQLPTYEQLLRYSRNVTGALRNIGDPDLLMASTIAYELGFDYSFLDDYLVQIAGFYRDISDQQDFTTYISNATSGNFQYTRPNNNSYQDIRGLEVTVRKTGGTWWSGFVNYTYQSAKSGRFNTDRIYQDITDQRRYDLNTRNLYQFRPIPTPYARMNLQFFTPPDLGPALAGQSLLGDWAVSIIGDWRSGGFATWNPNSDPSIENNVPLVDYLNVNLRISKTFTIGPAHLMLFADVQNVLDTRRLNLNSFYDGNDQRDYYNSLHLPTNPGYENIAGEDKVGDYRRDGAAFQPVEVVGALGNITVPDPKVIYFEKSSRRYAAFVNNAWADVEAGRLQQMLDDKAYIDMPNMSSFWFLNPRQVFWGLRMTFDF